jgi:hypothetical protein
LTTAHTKQNTHNQSDLKGINHMVTQEWEYGMRGWDHCQQFAHAGSTHCRAWETVPHCIGAARVALGSFQGRSLSESASKHRSDTHWIYFYNSYLKSAYDFKSGKIEIFGSIRRSDDNGESLFFLTEVHDYRWLR